MDVNDEKPRTEKHETTRSSLPQELVPTFDALVAEYKFYATVHHRKPFVSYVVLADLVRSGWRKLDGDDTRITEEDN